ncbi:MAG: zinc metalloprotease HtpX [Candidatus Methanoperedens sp.]|jgi:heat shock protein HtpX|nr:zinc metalloprotease HtpX [Candidatus Methanoperedens sp.]PKL53238.1 MAG: peptidase [Candidatus Methanoperedenaceae archaeon HGW-Methanoperedenaceae-1]
MWLKLRLYLVMTLLFAIIYAIAVVAAKMLGVGGGIYFYGFLASFMMFIQYMIGPKMVEWSMHVKYVDEKEAPSLHRMVTELARDARIPKPRIGIARTQIPNAFAFGRWAKDGRVCVTEGIMGLLDEKELRAVLAHEMSHLKNRDVAVITMISVIPMICWYLAWSFMFSGGRDRGNNLLIGIAAFVLYFISNLMVLYVSRIREYYADEGAVKLGSSPHHLASALFKLVYGSARIPKDTLKQAEGMKAFFASDPSRAAYEIRELSQIDIDRSGTIDMNELLALRTKPISISSADKFMEMMSTHPNMLKRIQRLSSLHGVSAY